MKKFADLEQAELVLGVSCNELGHFFKLMEEDEKRAIEHGLHLRIQKLQQEAVDALKYISMKRREEREILESINLISDLVKKEQR